MSSRVIRTSNARMCVEPLLQRLVVAVPAQQAHPGVGVRVDQPGRDDPPAAVDVARPRPGRARGPR